MGWCKYILSRQTKIQLRTDGLHIKKNNPKGQTLVSPRIKLNWQNLHKF